MLQPLKHIPGEHFVPKGSPSDCLCKALTEVKKDAMWALAAWTQAPPCLDQL